MSTFPTSGDEQEVNENAPDSTPVIPSGLPSSGEDEALENNLNDDGSVKSGASLDRLPETPSVDE